ncbi:MAG: hypothetical protein OXU51_18745 [Candidatus Poribacteria bacterium]|nr:hypothetical protein [Candidatus Poribacteria bacterium]
MKLKEKHKQFVVKSFASFMKLTDIVDAFIEEFEDELPPLGIPDIPSIDQIMAEPLDDSELRSRSEFIAMYVKKNLKAFDEKYGKDTDEKLNASALAAFNERRADRYIKNYQLYFNQERAAYEKQLRQDLFNQFRRLDINHRQFPEKYRDLFNQTREQYCASYRVPDLTNPESLARELETLYGYQKQRLFQVENQTEITKHIGLAHQILKTLVACNALNAEQDIVNITPENPKPLEEKK